MQYEAPIILDKLTLTAGTKLEHNNFSGFEYQPSVRLLWTPTDKQSFWAALTRAVRTPSRLDQDVQFAIFVENAPPPVYFNIEGSPTFQSEHLLSYEAGYRVTITPHVYLDVASFYNIYHDLQNYGALSLAVSATPPPLHLNIVVPYANGIEGHTIGAEIAPNWQITHWWQVRGSYSYLHMALKDAPGITQDTGNLLSTYAGSSPQHSVVFQSLLSLPKRFDVDASYRYVSGVPAQNVSAYQTGDVRLGWHFAENVEFSVVGQNLLQPYHAEFGGDPGALVEIKRSVYGKVTWRR